MAGYPPVSKDNAEDIGFGSGKTPNLDSVQEFINHAWSAGSGGESGEFDITENGDGTVDVTGGVMVLRSAESDTAELKPYDVSGVTNLAFVDNTDNYIICDYNAGSPVITSTDSVAAILTLQTKTVLYALTRVGTHLNIIDVRGINVDYARKNNIKDFKINGFEHAGGALVSDEGSRNFAITASEFYALNQPIVNAPFDTVGGGTFEYLYRDGAGGYTRVAAQTQIDNANWDDGTGTLNTLGNNKYMAHYVYIILNTPSHYKVVYGREQHNSLAQAQAEGVPITESGDIGGLSTSVLIAKIIVQAGVDAFEDIQSPFTKVLSSTAVSNHNNLAGLQGGAVGDYQHLTTAQVAEIAEIAANTAYRGVGHIPLSQKATNNGVATLDGGGKISASQLPSTVMDYLGNWNASTNTPTLIDGTGDNGDVYRVNVAGTQDLGSGSITFAQGDWAVYSGTIWEQSPNSDAVVSINGQTGIVVLDADDIDDTSTAHKFATQAQLDLADSAVQENDSPTFNKLTTTGNVCLEKETTSTTGSARLLTLLRESTGDMADGFGINVQFRIKDDAGVENIISKILSERDGSDNEGSLILKAGTDGNENFISLLSSTDCVKIHKDVQVTGDIAVTGAVDGRNLASDGSKLDGIEAGSTADQTKADIDALGINASQVQGLIPSQFLRSDASDILDVGRGNVHLEDNANDNQDGSGITIRCASNPSGGSESSGSAGSIFAVRSSGQGCRLWVGQSETTTGDNDFVTNDAQFDGNISVTSNTNSTSSTTGSIQTDGGLGVVKNTYLGGTLDVASTIRATSSTSDTNTSVTVATIARVSTGDMSDGFGPNLRFNIQDDTSSPEPIGRILARRDGADNEGEMIFRAGTDGNDSFITLSASSDNIQLAKDMTTTGSIASTVASGEVAVFGNSAFANKYINIRDGNAGLKAGLDVNSGASGIQTGSSKKFAVKVNSTADFDLSTPDFSINNSGNATFAGNVTVTGTITDYEKTNDQGGSGYYDVGDTRTQFFTIASTQDSAETITFPIAFSSAPYMIQVTLQSTNRAQAVSVETASITATTFDANRADAVQNGDSPVLHVMAIGPK
tara:strand:+ start:805 stop:4059 length:3255 start_codon:yes stop_codon:yes gene_type:complete